MTSETVSNKKILTASVIAVIVAAILLITAILPAEFDLDPLGTGKLLGISGMSSEETMVGVVNQQSDDYHQDSYTVKLLPYEFIEYKYRLEAGGTMVFNWQATGEVKFDLHAEKDGIDPEEYSPSFDQRQSAGEKGSYTAPFGGIHGWYFRNDNSEPVTVTLNSVGFFSKAIEFTGGFENEKDF